MKPPDDSRTPPSPMTFAHATAVVPVVSSTDLVRFRDAKLVVRVHARDTVITATVVADLVVRE